jgi:hypothetical protein
MSQEDELRDDRDNERAQAAADKAKDLPVPDGDADRVKGGAVGPCFRPK